MNGNTTCRVSESKNRLAILRSFLGLSALFLAGCSSPADPSDGSPGSPASWCDALTLSASSGEPGAQIPLTGAPTDLTNVYAQVTVPDESEPSRALVVEAPDGGPGQAVLIVPIHPTTPFAGGVLTLTFTDGAQSCAPVPLEVTALPDPDAPEVQGTLTRQAAGAQANLDSRAQALGVEPAALKGSLEGLPTEALPLALAQFFIDHPQNPNSLVAVAERGSVLENGAYEPFDRKLMDALAYQFDFANVLGGGSELQTLQANEACIGRAALASPQHLSTCMNQSQDLQELYDTFALQAKILSYALVPVLIFVPTLSLPTLYLGYAFYFINSTLMISAQASPRELAALTFAASPTTLLGAAQSGSWSDVQVTVADTPPIDLAELVKGMIDAMTFSALVPALGPVFDRYVSVLLMAFKEAFADDLNNLEVPYSTYGPVDITAYRESYRPSLAAGDELRLTGGNSYAPSEPFRDGRVDLILAINEGYFNDAAIQGAQQITVGTPMTEDEPFTITAVDAPAIPWGGSADIAIAWAGEGIVFPVELTVRVADCGLDECDLTGYTVEGRTNPIIYPVACETNNPTPGASVAGVTFSLSDSTGKTTPAVPASLQCGTSRSARLEPLNSGGRGVMRSVP